MAIKCLSVPDTLLLAHNCFTITTYYIEYVTVLCYRLSYTLELRHPLDDKIRAQQSRSVTGQLVNIFGFACQLSLSLQSELAVANFPLGSRANKTLFTNPCGLDSAPGL